MSWNLFLSLLGLDYVFNPEFLRLGMTEETNLKLETSTQALTQMILHVA